LPNSSAHEGTRRFRVFDSAGKAAGDNLPAELSSFIGRDREIAQVESLLGDTRLLTLTGAGGSGKTRLALAAASRVAGGFGVGVWWVGLAALSDPTLVPQAVAQALNIREDPGRPLTATLEEYLRPKEALLVLDNCEHLVESCAALVDALLRACPMVRVLATSREPLGVDGETSYPVPPLSVPDPEDPLPGEDLARYEAVQLFVERARSVAPSFEMTEENAGAVVRVCRRLDGMPLAIELAAARVRVLSAEQIAARLDDSFGLLKGSRMALPHQRTLRATMDWSHDLLSEEEKALFRRLSVFVGGFTLDAVEAVCTGDVLERGEVLDLLGSLIDKSLAVAEAGEGGALRYRMLEPIRQYGMERLETASGTGARSDESWAVRQRHLAWFLKLAQKAEPGLAGSHEGIWLERLDAEHGNIRAALGWSLDSGDAGLGLRLAGLLGGFWYKRGHLSEGRRWLERQLAGGSTSPAGERARALDQAGWMALYQGNLEAAVALLEESLSLFKELEDEPGIAASIAKLGHAVLHQDDRKHLAMLCEEAESLRGELVDRRAIGELLVFLGMVALYEGGLERAVALLEESLDLFRGTGDRSCATERRHGKSPSDELVEANELPTSIELVAGQAQEYLWLAALEGEEHERAKALLEEEIQLSRELGNKPKISYCLLGLAVMAALQGLPGRAARLWAAAEGLREDIGLALVLWDHTPTDYEALLVGTRTTLGGTAWEVARAEGRAMTLDQAIEYALTREEAGLPRPPQGDSSGPSAAYPAGLSVREVEVLGLVTRGLTNAQIARKLFISPNTVNRHLNSIYRKIGASSRAAATRFASEHRLA
jgi:predicted ATPase/DNA-binding CsgD family transcriptional regulator